MFVFDCHMHSLLVTKVLNLDKYLSQNLMVKKPLRDCYQKHWILKLLKENVFSFFPKDSQPSSGHEIVK